MSALFPESGGVLRCDGCGNIRKVKTFFLDEVIENGQPVFRTGVFCRHCAKNRGLAEDRHIMQEEDDISETGPMEAAFFSPRD